MIDRYTNEKMWCVLPKSWTDTQRLAYFEELRANQDDENYRLSVGTEPIPVERSHEYFSRILNAIETNQPYEFNGNVKNRGLISNLPADAVVEIPILADGNGLNPSTVGELPPVLAAYIQLNLNVQELAVKGFIEKERKHIYHAALMDPLASSVLELPDLYRLVDELFAVDEEYIDF